MRRAKRDRSYRQGLKRSHNGSWPNSRLSEKGAVQFLSEEIAAGKRFPLFRAARNGVLPGPEAA